jgi:hypothetical protein
MSVEKLAKMCAMMNEAFRLNVLSFDNVGACETYTIIWNHGVELCHGKAVDFYQLVDLAQQGGV